MKINWKELGILGVIGYILSLPILIWKNSRMGRIMFIFMFVGVMVYSGEKLSGVAFNVYSKWIWINHFSPILDKVEEIEAQLVVAQEKIERITENSDKLIKERIESSIGPKIAELSRGLEEIDASIKIIKEQERQAVKEKIIEMKEQVKVYGKSIDVKNIRLMCEQAVASLEILTQEEKERFKKDLRDIGFFVEEQKNETIRVHGNTDNWMYISGDVSFM